MYTVRLVVVKLRAVVPLLTIVTAVPIGKATDAFVGTVIA